MRGTVAKKLRKAAKKEFGEKWKEAYKIMKQKYNKGY